MSESSEQAKFHRIVWNNYPSSRYLCYHIPNEAKRTGYAFMIAMGMVPGIPDYHCNIPNIPYKSLYLEFKSEIGTLSENQKKAHSELIKKGHRVEVVRSFDEAIKIFTEYIKGTEHEIKR
jgi:hypothetical protein